MAKLRKGSAYNQVLKRPYTRRSKYRAKNFIRAAPHSKVVRYIMGNPNKKFEYTLTLTSKKELQIRHNALESARMSGNRWLETKAGKTDYFLQLRKHPHHLLRDNVLASGAGADRMSTGMAGSYGKVVGLAAQVHKDDVLFIACVDKKNLGIAKEALIRCKNKLPCKCQIIESKN
ncbi:MAG: 50S ribosomal protein L16 [Candidatus Woesearchaeota archaeon]